MYEVILMNMKHHIIERIETPYEYHIGEYVYPWYLQDKYPSYDENKHKVCGVRWLGDVNEK